MKIFGIEIFNFKENRTGQLISYANNQLKESRYLPDFYQATNNFGQSVPIEMFMTGSPTPLKAKKIKKEDKPINASLTAKAVYEFKMLNEKNFSVNTDKKYVEEQLEMFKKKLELVKTSEYDYTHGVTELQSIVIRMENRIKYPIHEKFYSQFAYTKTSKIEALLEDNQDLKMGKVEQFIADLPKEATEVMDNYKKETKALCQKFPIFYIIADKKDFEHTQKRKDPILLA